MSATDITLPVVDGKSPGKIKKSRNSRRRTVSLIAVHLLIIGHVAQYALAGRTLSPVEPSETMFTIELGYVTAGAIFFAAALLSTVAFGRVFCGWGCHVVAYQDLCAWLMRKLGVRPQPFRSRLLIYAPLLVALYMFIWPTAKRVLFGWPAFAQWVEGSPEFLQFIFGTQAPHVFPGFSNHLLTDGFWNTFPGPVFAVLTIVVCGFVAVYFLGSKGFCTYGCPYGGFFAPLDKLAVGKILVTDACEQCGHCTATCTSNVRVHEEVNLYGMVVDPGCMKCLDCVSVCPNDALYFGFAMPSIAKGRPRRSPTPRRYDFTVVEEIVMAAVFLIATLAMRGLYDGPPLLMSVAVGGITAYLFVKLWRLWRDPTVRIQNLRLKTAGRVGVTGGVVAAMVIGWMGFVAHSGVVQWHRAWGDHYLNLTEAGEEVITGRRAWQIAYSPQHEKAVAQGLRHYESADWWGLFDTLDVKKGLAWLHLCRGEDEVATRYLQEAIRIAPDVPGLRQNLVLVLLKQGRAAEAIVGMEQLFELRPATAMEHFRLAGLLTGEGRLDEAERRYRACLEQAPESAPAWYNLGGLLRRMGRPEEAIEKLRQALSLVPEDVDAHIELGLSCAEAGRVDEGRQYLGRAAQLAPTDPRPRQHLAALGVVQTPPRKP